MGALDTARTHIWRSPYQALAAVITMFVTFLLAGVFFLTTVASVAILDYFESKPQITVFFADKATQDEINTLKVRLEQTQKIASITYVSKEEALAIYREQNKNDPLLLEMVTADILPASLEVSATDPKLLSELEPLIKAAGGVEEVVYQKDVVDALLSWTNAIRIVGIVLVTLLTINSFLIVMTVIGMKIALRREEVEILTLVGATPWYIKFPFLLEGGWYGAIGALLSWIVIIPIVIWLQPFLLSFLGGIPIIYGVFGSLTSTAFLIFSSLFLIGLLLTGFLLGSVASLVAVGRFLQ
ncbi:hypothetical protein A3A79_04365 [Candidatus Gottesmanbacteria bacterium RIFCSPLOWO2_01_FULL_43_11b]|uniref:Cell division protein FtsX n=1 Tax=Candidatus Gottesmanbacteria bacterium RIFCSPLOWO2_01_FULL_43_11b TaxID=1798392 RepID=A0A1F6AI16_9BACT|nr:MAG: hypothetical protein A3A79_04365 [Candidatus Gottesmanbacteria bacterium RIFCSPLOWO2_01_FULL_43_11b]